MRLEWKSIKNARSLQGTKRSDLNDEQWKLSNTDKHQVLIEFVTYGVTLYRNEELDWNEFRCPEMTPIPWKNKATLEYCESCVQNRGCGRIKTCKAYLEEKRLEEAHPEINWQNPLKNTPQALAEIMMIKKGMIIPARNEETP